MAHETLPIITLDVIMAPTNRAKCHACKNEIKKGTPKGVIYLEVEFTHKSGELKKAMQNRSLCPECVRKNISALSMHLNHIAMKIGSS